LRPKQAFTTYLVEVESGVLGLEVNDQAPDGGGQPLAPGGFRAEEALHPLGLEAAKSAVEGARRDADLSRPLGYGNIAENQGANLLVALLLRPLEQR
jgi:hypothetical protein